MQRYCMEIISSSEMIQLRGDAGRYKSLHRRAVNRWEKQRQQSPEKGNGNGQRGKKTSARSDPEFPVTKNAGQLEKLHLQVVATKNASSPESVGHLLYGHLILA